MTMEPTKEDWVPLPGYEGLYEASTLGRLRSLPRIVDRGVCKAAHIRGRILRTSRNARSGYHYFRVSKGGRKAGLMVHQLVCEAFHGPRPTGLWVRHLDGDKSNNRPENLRWGTPRENMQDQFIHGARGLGERSPNVRLTDEKVLNIRARRAEGQKRLAKEFGVSGATIWAILAGKSWRHLKAA